jgi:hypothetical protein
MMPPSFVVAIFLVWGALSVLNQFSSGVKRSRFPIFLHIKRNDHFSLIPLWTFFAPNPGTRDHDVFFRDQLVDGASTPWRQLSDNSVPWSCAVWNPRKRLKKAKIDMTVFLAQHLIRAAESRKEEAARSVFVSLPYIGLAMQVTAAPHGPLSARRQFMVALSYGYGELREPDILFISPLFDLR